MVRRGIIACRLNLCGNFLCCNFFGFLLFTVHACVLKQDIVLISVTTY